MFPQKLNFNIDTAKGEICDNFLFAISIKEISGDQDMTVGSIKLELSLHLLQRFVVGNFVTIEKIDQHTAM